LQQENLNKVASVEDVTSPKEHKVSDSNDGAPGGQSSTPEDGDDAEHGAAGDNSTFQVLIAVSHLELDQCSFGFSV
jgi:hypothetical protein